MSSAKTMSTERFVTLVERSGLVDKAELASFFAELAEESSGEIASEPERIAQRMIERKLLNRWQADNLLKGKYKGFRLGKYNLLGHLGTGGMSTVYLAEHPVMERMVAIKVLPSRYLENPNYLARFEREAKAVAKLDHPNIVRAYDIDRDGKNYFIVMEHVDGRDLQRIVKQDGPVSSAVAADLIMQAARGLHHAHRAGLVHRDVKPANCLLDENGVVKLLDMGLAKFTEDQAGISAKYEDSVVGTADYLAPEQARNSQTVDARADIYSLGCTLYFLLTGQPPFPTGNITERLIKHQTAQPTSIYELRSDAHPAIVDLCRRMMIKSANERIQSADLVEKELQSWLEGPGKSKTGSRSRLIPRRLAAPATNDDTISGATSDTSRTFNDSRNDNLTLAPDDEQRAGRPAVSPAKDSSDSDANASSSKVTSSGRVPKRTAEGSSSSVTGGGGGGGGGIASHDTNRDQSATNDALEDFELSEFGKSGPLDALLDDPTFRKRTIMPTAQLTSKRRETGYGTWFWLGLAAVGFVLFAIILSFLLASPSPRPAAEPPNVPQPPTATEPAEP